MGDRDMNGTVHPNAFGKKKPPEIRRVEFLGQATIISLP